MIIREFVKYSGNGSASDIQSWLDNQIDPGQALWMQGAFQISGGLSLPAKSNVGIYLEGSITTKIGFPANTSLITFASGTRGQFIIGSPESGLPNGDGSTLDGAHRAKYLISGTACKDIHISTLTMRNWKYGIYLTSKNTAPYDPLVNPVIEDVTLINDASSGTIVEYPIQITSLTNGKRVEGGEIRRCTILSVPGAYGDNNPYTADQIALQGVEDFLVTDCRSYNGGENGLAISRCSQRVSIVRCHGVGADKNGIQIGSALAAIWFDDLGTWAVDDILETTTGPLRKGKIEAIVDYGVGFASQIGRPARYEVRLNLSQSVVGTPGVGLMSVGQSITNGTTAKTIAVLDYTDNITIEGCYFVDNGINTGIGQVRAGIFATRTRGLSVDAIGGGRKTKTQQYNGYFSMSHFNVDRLIPTGTVGIANHHVTGSPDPINLSDYIACATVDAAGDVQAGFGCDVSKVSTGTYLVAFTDSGPLSADAYFVSATLEQSGRDMPPQIVDKTATGFKVLTGNNGTLIDTAFALSVWRID